MYLFHSFCVRLRLTIRQARACQDVTSTLVSHRRTILSPLAEARREPSGLKTTLYTQPVCPSRGALNSCPVVASHRRTVSSALAEARREPSGLKATLTTAAVCPSRGWPTGWPVVAS